MLFVPWNSMLLYMYKNRKQLFSTCFIPFIGKQNYTQNQFIPLAVTKILTTWQIVTIFKLYFLRTILLKAWNSAFYKPNLIFSLKNWFPNLCSDSDSKGTLRGCLVHTEKYLKHSFYTCTFKMKIQTGLIGIQVSFFFFFFKC